MTALQESIRWPDPVALVVFDFDGVMTDNRVYVSEDGKESVVCNRADGLGIDRLREAAVPMIILSTEMNPVVAARARKLRIPAIHGIGDKRMQLERHLAEQAINPAHVVYIGNDLNDLGCFTLVGFPVAVADAAPELRSVAKLVLSRKGGEGAVREFCDVLCEQMLKHHPHRS
jgi:YrbI family 3-deoxy-D-manno-octulosonate 8-phosphate phosphatase